jgi:hypothetical protein
MIRQIKVSTANNNKNNPFLITIIFVHFKGLQ